MKIGKLNVFGDTLSNSKGFHKVATGSYAERAGSADLPENSKPTPRPAVNGMIRYNTDRKTFEAYIRNKWSDIFSDRSIFTSGVDPNDPNVTLNYLSVVLTQLSRNIVGQVEFNTVGAPPYGGGNNAGPPDYIESVNNGTVVGEVENFGNPMLSVIPMWLGDSTARNLTGYPSGQDWILASVYRFECIIDAFKLSGLPEKERFNYLFDGFAVHNKILMRNSNTGGVIGQETGRTSSGENSLSCYTHLNPIWTRSDGTDPNYGKFKFQISTHSSENPVAGSMGVVWFVKMFKFQNYELEEFEVSGQEPVGDIPNPIVFNINSNRNELNVKSEILLNYPNWDAITPVNVEINIAPGVILGSSQPEVASLTISELPIGSTVIVVNNGIIMGSGGNGGAGGQINYNNDWTLNPDPSGGFLFESPLSGLNGGTAVNATYTVTIDNTNGQIVAGGGGGAGGPAFKQELPLYNDGSDNLPLFLNVSSSDVTSEYQFDSGNNRSDHPDQEEDNLYVEIVYDSTNDRYGLIVIADSQFTTSGITYGSNLLVNSGNINVNDFDTGIPANPEFAIDNDNGTFWKVPTGSLTTLDFWEYDFGNGNDRNIRRLTMRFPNTDNRPSTMLLEYSNDGSLWNTAETLTPSGGIGSTEEFLISDNGDHRYWRVSALPSDTIDRFGITEITMHIATSIGDDGAATIEVTGLPNTSTVAVSDDPGQVVKSSSTSITANLEWNDDETGGFAIDNINSISELNGVTISYSAGTSGSNNNNKLTRFKFKDSNFVDQTQLFTTSTQFVINTDFVHFGGSGGGGGAGFSGGSGGSGGIVGLVLDPAAATEVIVSSPFDGISGNFGSPALGGQGSGGSNISNPPSTNGGDGGDLATPGSSTTGATGGNPGNAIEGNSNIIFINQGIITGNIQN